jgi:hypothetical protein
VWEEDKKRIEKLQFWKEVKGQHGFPEDIKVWHIHPLGLVENFAGIKRHPVIINEGERVELEFLDLNDGETISEEEFAAAASDIGCEVAVIKAIAQVESGAGGAYFNYSDWDRVPAILFERHKFHHYTNGAYDSVDANISHSSVSSRAVAYPGINGYWASKYQYQRLLKAYALDKTAALKSASWGRFQLMGFNWKTVPGVTSVEDMVMKFGASEKWHLRGLVGFIKSNSTLRNATINKNWLAFANCYNGTGHQNYDVLMENAYHAISNAQ